MPMFKINARILIRYILILCISIVLSYSFRLLNDFLVDLYPEHAYWIEKVVLIVFIFLLTACVMVPFTKLMGIKVRR
jgi:hypothetical protein